MTEVLGKWIRCIYTDRTSANREATYLDHTEQNQQRDMVGKKQKPALTRKI